MGMRAQRFDKDINVGDEIVDSLRDNNIFKWDCW